MEIKDLKEAVSHGTVLFPLAVYHWDGRTKFDVSLHWHDETEIIFLEKGIFSMMVNMCEYVVEGPAFAFVPGGDIHSLKLLRAQKESAVVFDLKMLSFEYFDGIQYEIIKPLMEKKLGFPQVLYPDSPAWKSVSRLYREILKESAYSRLSSYMRVKGCLYQLLASLYENQCFIQRDAIEETDVDKIAHIKKVISFIRERYTDKITVEETADLAGMNAQYFCRYFKRLTGKTLTEYINEVRIEKAAGLLTETEDKVITIAAACGYDNIGYFIKRFKQCKGMTPQEYRIKKSK